MKASMRCAAALVSERRLASSSRASLLGAARSSTTRTSSTLQRSGLSSSPIASSSRSHSTHAAPLPQIPIPEIGVKDTYDIVIIGAGNAGLALACALLDKESIRSTSRILLLEGGTLDRVKSWKDDAHWENRVSSLTSENIGWLESIGVWKHIAQQRSCPVNEMVIWANPTTTQTPSIHFPPLDHPMARMTENTNLQRALLRRIDEVGQGIVEIKEGSRVAEMRLGEGERWVGLRIGEDSWVRGAVVVGADGPNSPVRHFSHIESFGHGYETHGLVATLRHAVSSYYPNNTAFQRFLPTGPIAFLPLSPDASTMVWSTHPSHAAAYKRLEPEALTHMVNAGYSMHEAPLMSLVNQVVAADKAGTPLSKQYIQDTITQLNLTGTASLTSEEAILPATVTSIEPKSIASFPLRLSHAESYLGNRTVLVGDAAHTTHPLAGQGLNMGLADVRSLANTWDTARRQGGDLGAQTSTLDYPRERYPQNALLLTTTDTLHHVFRNRSAPLNWARGLGLELINEIGPLKMILMGGAGARPGTATRSNVQREFGRTDARQELGRSTGGWPNVAATGLEGWLGFKNVVGTAAGFAEELAKNGLRRVADAMEQKK